MDNDTEGQHVKARPQVQREAFHTPRTLDFLSEKELTAQTGHPRPTWPLVLVKELVDNSLDACEEAGIAPKVTIKVDDHGLTITDNGPGIPPEVVAGALDFSVRVSSREAYLAPDRGAQGNALMTVIAMPYVMDEEQGRVTIRSQGRRTRLASLSPTLTKDVPSISSVITRSESPTAIPRRHSDGEESHGSECKAYTADGGRRAGVGGFRGEGQGAQWVVC